MSTDIQVISLVDDLQVISVEDIQGASPRTLRVIGSEGFSHAQSVLINGYPTVSFQLISDTVLLVNVGAFFDGTPVTSMAVTVVSATMTGTRSVRLVLGPSVRLGSVSGVQKLVQHVVKVLLTNVGSNRFRPGAGGGLLRMTAFDLSPDARPKIVAGISHALSATEKQIVASNSTERSLPASERLLGLSLGDVTFNENTLEATASIRLTTYGGESASIPIIL